MITMITSEFPKLLQSGHLPCSLGDGTASPMGNFDVEKSSLPSKAITSIYPNSFEWCFDGKVFWEKNNEHFFSRLRCFKTWENPMSLNWNREINKSLWNWIWHLILRDELLNYIDDISLDTHHMVYVWWNILLDPNDTARTKLTPL